MKVRVDNVNLKPRARRKDKSFCCLICKKIAKGQSHGRRGKK
jgi:hypothetical protein